MNNSLPTQKDEHKESKEPAPPTRNATYRPYSYRRNGTTISSYSGLNKGNDSRSEDDKPKSALTVYKSSTAVNQSSGPILKGPSFCRHRSYCNANSSVGFQHSSTPKSSSKTINKIFQSKYNNKLSRSTVQNHKWTRSSNNDKTVTSPNNKKKLSNAHPDSDKNGNIHSSVTNDKKISQLPSMTKVKNNALVLSKALEKDKKPININVVNVKNTTTDTTNRYNPDFPQNSHETSSSFYNNSTRISKQGFRKIDQRNYNGDGVAKRIRLNHNSKDVISDKELSITINENRSNDHKNLDTPEKSATELDDIKDTTDSNSNNYSKGKVFLTDFAYVSSTSSKTNHKSKNRYPDGRHNSSSISKSNYKKNRGLVRVQPDVLNTPICKTFAHGLICTNIYCTKRHDVPAEAAMPLCSFFQRNGQCLKNLDGTCPFRHVKVNPSVMNCPSFTLLGFCENKNCVMKHTKTKPRQSDNNNNKYKKNQTTNIKKT